MPIFCQKNVNSVKITQYDQKSEEDVLFFGYFRKKALMHIYFQKKNVHSFKRHCPHAHILSKKTSIFSKTLCFYVNFFKIFIESPQLSCPYLIKNINSIKTTLYYEQKKVNRMPFFPISHGKIIALMPIFCKKTSILQKARCSQVQILSKKRPFSQKHCAPMSFFRIFHDKPPAVKTLFGQNVNTVKITL